MAARSQAVVPLRSSTRQEERIPDHEDDCCLIENLYEVMEDGGKGVKHRRDAYASASRINPTPVTLEALYTRPEKQGREINTRERHQHL